MAVGAFDPEQYKAGQRRTWDDASSGWVKWWSKFEVGFGPISERILGLAELQPGQQVLDIATGIGEPALTAARQVGPTGRVLGIDISPQMLALAQQRAGAAGLANAEFRVADAEALDLPAASFDAALCRLGLMFLPNLPGALTGIRRVLRPGGRLAAAVWSTPDQVPSATVPMKVLKEMTAMAPPPPGAPGLFSLSEPGLLEQRLEEAGFQAVRTERLRFNLIMESAEAYLQMLRDTAGVIVNVVGQEPAERQDQIWQAIADGSRQYADPDGRIHFPAEVIVAVAQA